MSNDWTLEKALEHQYIQFDKRMKIRETKGHDYASANNILLNFYQMALLSKTLNLGCHEPWEIAMLYTLLKIQRLCNLLKGDKVPKNEALEDTIMDLKNYIDLMEECLIDQGIIELK